MLQALGRTVVEILDSKKAMITIAAIIASICARLGWHVDQTTILTYLGLVAVLVGAQGVADAGKSKAEVEAAAKISTLQQTTTPTGVTETVATSGPAKPPSGFVNVGLLFVVVTLAFGGACAWLSSSGGPAAKTAAIDCTKGELGKLESIAVATAPAIVAGTVTWSSAEDAAVKAGEEIGGCFLAHLWDAVPALHGVEGQPPAQLALEHFRKRTGSSRALHTSHADH